MINKHYSNIFYHSTLKIHLLLLTVQCMFAILPSLAKIAFKNFSPEIILFFRIAGSAIIFSFFFFLFMYEKINCKKDYAYLALLSIFGVVANQLLFLKGVFYSTAINANIIITTIPIFTLILSSLFSYERITLSKIIGILISLIGVFSILDIRNFSFSGYTLGNTLIILNSISYSLYLVLAKPILKRYQPFTVITYIFLFATIESIPFCYKSFIDANFSSIKAIDYFIPAAIIIFSTFLPYTINTNVLKIVNSSIVAIYVYIQPLIGTIFAIILINEKITLQLIISALLILLGVHIVSSSSSGNKNNKSYR